MPSIANITVKKADNTTDIVYDALSGSGGDGGWAVWRQDTGANAALPVGMRSIYQLVSRWNGPKTARRFEGIIKMPYAVLDANTGLYRVQDTVLLQFGAVIPQGVPASHISEACYQGCNLLAAGLTKQQLTAGYAAV
jgi:hypothetical protein